MAIDTHIKFDGVDGESTRQDHKNWIEVLSWSWDISNSAAMTGGSSGRGKGRATAGALNFMHTYDKASPTLAKRCADGKHFEKVEMVSRKSGEGQKEFLTITLKDVFITSVAPSGSSGGDIAEAISMTYGQIDFSYKPQDGKGAVGAPVLFGLNVETGKIT